MYGASVNDKRSFPWWVTQDAEIQVLFAENRELSKILTLRPEVGQNV